ncbi:PQQ-dependent sugar dehydrogenase [Sphingobacterium paludis]|jgi:glucose/arabinose dehydrogenase|uniref:Glucose/arabinose dehydrogenase n=1 Tax=Sphingobacterium paludis TaxID=1476465 RepID=A0A4R7D4T8_9SPHI|nr:sorbosone dehydrogenase family protein [Sphingobacterium paludis]TDS16099.1 glucose/arabinose dehydrogenase [Sphingobacterium paludis]
MITQHSSGSTPIWLSMLAVCSLMWACGGSTEKRKADNPDSSAQEREFGMQIVPQEPLATPAKNKFSKVKGWEDGETPTANAGFQVVRFADSLNSPRNVYVAANGDVYVAQARTETKGDDKKADSHNEFRSKSPNNIIRLRDTDGDGVADERETVLSGLAQPFGMLIAGNWFYVANTDGLMRYPYRNGKIDTNGKKIVSLPAGGYNNHWTRNIILNADSTKMYISVGSGSNVGENGMEHEVRRAAILEVNLDGSGERIFASGIRNPVGMDIEPHTSTLWTAVNERDELGDELVPDYLTSVKNNGFYGWPYTYWGKHEDPRWKNKLPKDMAQKSITPDFAVGAHTASLGLSFNKAEGFPEGAYIGQHGSWNRSTFSGYKVIFVPFSKGRPAGEAQDFLTGFISNADNDEVYGRPVAIAFTPKYMLVTDDAANIIWTVMPENVSKK